jgi:hypothetical protein
MSHSLYLPSYDVYDDVLQYSLPEGASSILSRARYTAGTNAFAFGLFTREGPHVAGIFASPDGPIVFLDTRRVICRFGRTMAATEAIAEGPTRQFTLQNDGATEFSLSYKERVGLGVNPYDTELEDIDLFAMIARGLRNEQFFRNYTRAWPSS